VSAAARPPEAPLLLTTAASISLPALAREATDFDHFWRSDGAGFPPEPFLRARSWSQSHRPSRFVGSVEYFTCR